MTLRIKTPAKINLFLNIRGVRPDGFHELAMVMQTVSLFDELLIEPDFSKRDIQLQYAPNELGRALSQESFDDNLVVKAYRQFYKSAKLPPLGLNVTLTKFIPLQAGLGGGSSDAAAMILALNHLSCAHLPLQTLRQIGAGVGSDVPFFLTGGAALVSGRGEQVEPLGVELASREWLYAWVLIKPKSLNISTHDAYQAVRQSARYQSLTPEYLMLALGKLAQNSRQAPELSEGRLKEFESYFLNDFESVLFPIHPQLEQMANHLRDLGAYRPLLCGSGPTMSGLLPVTHQNQRAITQAFPASQYDVFWAYPHNGGPVQAHHTASPPNKPASVLS